MAFPASIDNFTNPTATDKMNVVSHSSQHANINDAVEALEAKVGADSSAVTTSHDYKIAQLEGKTSGTVATELVDSNLTIKDNSDGTKKFKFEASSITAGNTRTLTVPDASITVLGEANTATVTNKAIDLANNTLTGTTAQFNTALSDDNFVTGLTFYNSVSRQGAINGDFQVAQQATSSTPNDDTYVMDVWNTLTETNAAWTYSQSTDAPTGSKYALKAVKTATGANAQCALCLFFDSARAAVYKGQTASFTFAAKTSTGKVISNLRATLLSWNSTADSITSDVIGTWAQDGTDPTWATNWTSEKAGSNLALAADTYTEFKVENIAVDTANVTNLALVVWVDDGTISTGDEFYISAVGVNIGANALPFCSRPYKVEEAEISYFFKPLHAAKTGVQVTDVMFPSRITLNIVAITFQLIGTMRTTTPTLINTLSSFQSANPSSDGQYSFYDWQAGAFLGINGGSITTTLHKYGDTACVVRFTNSANYANGAAGNITSMEIYGGGLFLDARL